MKIKTKVRTPKQVFRATVKRMAKEVNKQLATAFVGAPTTVTFDAKPDPRVSKALCKLFRKGGWYVTDAEKDGKYHFTVEEAAPQARPADESPTN